MKTVRNLISVFFLSIASTICFAQTPSAVLTSGDIDKYVNTIKPMAEELSALEDDYDDEPEDASLWKYPEVRAILQKYGWDENYVQKFGAITVGTAYLIAMEEIEKMPAEQAENYRALYTGHFKDAISEDDLSLLKSRFGELKNLFEEMSEEAEDDE